jgi:Holliday junction DNA helicase RuvA
MLQAIQGVGPKAALAVLDVLSPPELAAAAAREDKAAVARAQGVGPKLAQRIVVELKDKPISDGPVAAFHAQISAPGAAKPSLSGEAVAALMGLGVAEPAARRVVEQAAARLGEEAAAPALIKAALQELGR